jgi:hypothetical protein
MQAGRLREAARTLRHLSGRIKYHPTTGVKPLPTPGLTGALEAIEQVLNELQRSAGERADEETALSDLGDAAARQIRFGGEAVERGAQVAAAAIEVLRGVLSASEGATLDAPYGHGAPRRHHPGALCTIVAERAESLASALEASAIAKVNLAGAG